MAKSIISKRERLARLQTKLKMTVKPRLTRISSKFEGKITRALSTPESRKSRKKREQRIRQIAFFALTSFAIGSAIYLYPPARNLVVSSAVKLKSNMSELFSSGNLETDPLADPSFESSQLALENGGNRKIPRRLLIVLVTIVAALVIKEVGPSIISSFDVPVEASKEAAESTVKSIADTPADDSTCGIGPEDWPSWARILFHVTAQAASIVYLSVFRNWAELARAEQIAKGVEICLSNCSSL